MALLFVALGVAAAIRAYAFGLGTTAEPGAGFLPFWASVLIVGCAAAAAVDAFSNKPSPHPAAPGAPAAGSAPASTTAPASQRKVWLCVLMLVLYVIALPLLGFPIATFAVMLALSRFDPRTSWAGSFAIAFLGALAFWGIFVAGLGVNFPAASLGWRP